MELLSCHWRILVNLDPHNAMLPIGNNFVFGSSAWIPLPRKWHWKGKVTRGWYSTWVKTQKFANCRFTEANFTSYIAILWFALGYAKICALWLFLNWPLVINKSYVSIQRTIDQSNKTAILREGFKKKSMEFSILSKTHPPHSPSMEKKIKITWSKNHFDAKIKESGIFQI